MADQQAQDKRPEAVAAPSETTLSWAPCAPPRALEGPFAGPLLSHGERTVNTQ